jgi:hypothetical protein
MAWLVWGPLLLMLTVLMLPWFLWSQPDLAAVVYTVQKIFSINLCSWSLCCIECKLGHYWTQKFLTSFTGKFCAAFELKHFTSNCMKKYVLLGSSLPFSVMAPCSYHKIMLKLISALFQSSFTSPLL